MIQETINSLLKPIEVSDLVVNGAKSVFLGTQGKWLQVESPFESEDQLREYAVALANQGRKRLDYASPFADLAIDGLRYHVALPAGSVTETFISIRKHQAAQADLSTLIDNADRWLAPLYRIIQERKNFIICGGTGSGKTTLLRAMLELDKTSRVITCEDVSELNLSTPNVVPFQTRQANTDGAGSIDLQRLVIESLRMKPDRLVIGEVRGSELVPMLQALNSGHQGSATTIHANRADDVPARLIGIGLVGGLSPATTSHLAASAFEAVICLGPRVRGLNISTITQFALNPESRLVTRHEF